MVRLLYYLKMKFFLFLKLTMCYWIVYKLTKQCQLNKSVSVGVNKSLIIPARLCIIILLWSYSTQILWIKSLGYICAVDVSSLPVGWVKEKWVLTYALILDLIRLCGGAVGRPLIIGVPRPLHASLVTYFAAPNA